MYEDNLYLSNLYDYLAQPILSRDGSETSGPDPSRGLEFENVSFTYPGASAPALSDVRLQIRPGESLALVGENGSGKTTLIKLLTRLYEPTGDVRHIDDKERWRRAATTGLAAPFIETMPEGYNTQLGRWFRGGRELSGGQWQKIALSRAFMRSDADILVLDEPTAAMDAQSEADVFEHFRTASGNRMTILISHRFSTVRAADKIVVIRNGSIVERGNHDSLLAADGRYAHLFRLQARGYQ